MPTFGPKSLERLETCHPKLQALLHAAIADGPDFTVLCGHRGPKEQNEAVEKGLSKVRWPNSRHNTLPSLAVDIAPWPIDWNDYSRFKHLAEHIIAKAGEMGIQIRWGGDWDRDGKTRHDGDKDEKFVDLPHFELVEV